MKEGKTIRTVKFIAGKKYAVEVGELIGVYCQATAYGKLQLCYVRRSFREKIFDIVEPTTGLVLIADVGRLTQGGFRNLCNFINSMCAEQILKKISITKKITEYPIWDKESQ